MSYPLPRDEAERLRVLPGYDLLGSRPEAQFDEIARLAAELFRVPICLVTIIGKDEQWLKARWGVDLESTTREDSFCTYTILSTRPLVVLDAAVHERFRASALVVGGPGIRFYAGAPITTSQGVNLGALCLIDTVPRDSFSSGDEHLLVRLAAMVSERVAARHEARPIKTVGSFAEATGLALITADDHGDITFWNAAAERLFGYPRVEMVGRSLQTIMPERFRDAHRAGIERVRAGGAPVLSGKTAEVIALRRDGTEFPIELSLSSWRSERGVEFGAHVQDITERRDKEARLHHLAIHDGLTGLLNRTAFRDVVDRRLGRGERAVVLALDLDTFKAINDALGHAVGDALLQTITIRLATHVGDGGVLGRLGGDEFALLLPPDDGIFEAQAAARCILEAFASPFEVAGHQLHVGTSIGIAMAPDHADDVDDLLVRADLALFRAKKAGGRGLRMFDTTMAGELEARRAFKDELLQAFVEDQWELHYQPQVNIADGTLIGVEALLRWRHPQWGILLPAVFMPVLETHLVAHELGSWIIREACRQLARWRRAGIDVPRIGVNLFPAQVHGGSLGEVVGKALTDSGLCPSDLELEITENITLRQDDAALSPLRDLHAFGVGVALDDFGTGFASLCTLRRLPLTRLKIDRSFVQDLCTDDHSVAVVSAIVAIGRILKLEVIAEGIETADQADRLTALGCLQAQGFLYGAAMPADDVFTSRSSRSRAARSNT